MRTIVVLLVPFMFLFPGWILVIQEQDEIESTRFDDTIPKGISDPDQIDLSLKGEFFTENLGQKSEGAGFFYAEGDPLSVGFGNRWVAYILANQDDSSKLGGVLYRSNFANCNPVPPIGFDMLAHKSNYFIGNDPDKWVSGASNFREIWYYNLWNGIDLKYYFKDGLLKYDLIVHPRADPNQIKFEYEGVENIEIESNNDLVIRTNVGSVTDQAPIAYQDTRDGINQVKCSFKIIDINSLTFEMEHYDHDNNIIIDPGLNFCTYLGGQNDDRGAWVNTNSYEVDEYGNTYVGGSSTYSDDFPTTVGAFNRTKGPGKIATVSKINSNGSSLIFSTFIGSKGEDQLQSIRVDNMGNIIGAGHGAGEDFPITNGSFQTVRAPGGGFIIKMNKNGSKLIFGSFLGGSDSNFVMNVGISNDGSYIVTGITSSTDFPGVSNGYDNSFNGGNSDAFVMRVNHDGTKITHASYLGGSDFERPFSIGFDSDDNVIIAGGSKSTDLPMDSDSYQRNLNGDYDGFIVKFNYNISILLSSTYIGGSAMAAGENDRVMCIKIGPKNRIFACGWTISSDFPTTTGAYDTTYNGGYGDYYYCIMDQNLEKMEYGTFFGGQGDENDMGFCGIDITNGLDVILVGTTNSNDIPTTLDCIQSSSNGGIDIFIARFDITGYLKYCTYFGGNGYDIHFNTAHHDQSFTTISGFTQSTDLPTTSGAFDETYNGDSDYFVARIWTGYDLSPPEEVYEVNIYSDPLFEKQIEIVNETEEIFIELKGLDGNGSNMDFALVKVQSSKSDPVGFILFLKETGLNTGIYRNSLNISSETDPFLRYIKALKKEIINISSYKDPSVFALMKVISQVLLYPFEDVNSINEDEQYFIKYSNIGYNYASEWVFETEETWLNWDEENHILFGTPDNEDVGSCLVRLNITDGFGHYDEHHFNIMVRNTIPIILTENIIYANQSDYYYVDYNCDDEGQGLTRWHIDTLASWLRFDTVTGFLNGTPTQNDVGSYEINISVDDGNGGLNWTVFTLEVIDINEPPVITTIPIQSVYQNDPYYTDFMTIDPDGDAISEWHLNTNTKFLTMNVGTGELYGTPSNDDVGIFFVNVTGIDHSGLSDFINFTLEVIDVNDDPVWKKIPIDTEVDQGKIFSFQVEVVDVDIGDKITFRIKADLDIGIEIDPDIGLIEWNASIEGINPNTDYIIQVTVYASDGEVEISHWFSLKVIPNPSPLTKLLSPDDDELVPSTGIYLEWKGEDDSTGLKYDLYLSDSYNSILEFKEEALLLRDLTNTRTWVSELTQGYTYYWTVIPRDQYSIGTCQGDIFSLRVNTLPQISEIPNQTADIGEEFSLSISGSDPETSSDDLVFSLISAPEGMEIFGNQIFWTPGVNDIGIHTVEISLFDGLEYTNSSFDITVNVLEIEPQDDDGGFPIWIIFVILVIVILLIGIGIGAYIFVKKTGVPEPKEENDSSGEAGPIDKENQDIEHQNDTSTGIGDGIDPNNQI